MEDKFYSLSDDDIKKVFNNKIKIIKYSDIRNYNNIDQLLYPYGRVCLLWEYKEDYGHWCCLFRSDGGKEVKSGTLFYFDSFGTPIEGILKKIDNRTKNKLNQHEGYLLKMFKNRDIYYNPYKLQNNNTSVCGRYCIARMIFNNLSSKEFKKLFTVKGINRDELITFATNPLIFS